MIQQIQSTEAYQILIDNRFSILIDVRTEEEWQQVGIVDDTNFQNKAGLISWKILPQMTINQKFIIDLKKHIDNLTSLKAENKNSEDLLIFLICRSGGRSNQAAEYLQSIGYKNLYNIVNGFEGTNHNGLHDGWKNLLPTLRIKN